MTQTPFPFLLAALPEIISLIHQVILSDDTVENVHSSIETILESSCSCLLDNCKCLEGYHEWIRKNSAAPPPAVISTLDPQTNSHLFHLIHEEKWDQIPLVFENLKENPEVKRIADNWLSTLSNNEKLLESTLAKAKVTLANFYKANGKDIGEQFSSMKLGTLDACSPGTSAGQIQMEALQGTSSGMSSFPNQPIGRAPSFPVPIPRRRISRGNSDPKDVINILFLGERSAGKTTLINSIVNYVKNETLDEARREPIILKSTRGDDLLLSTLDPAIHCIPFIDDGTPKLLRLVDTPGFGDTRDELQDQANVDRTLSLIAEIGILSAICIVLKPNESKLSKSFKLSLGDIFLRINKDAVKSTLFCFTNTKPSDFKPGKTKDPLSEYMKKIEIATGVPVKPNEHNTFCFDNDCFRYMCVLMKKPSVARNDNTYREFSKTWTHNVQEYRKLLTKVKSREAARVEDMITIDKIQRILAGIAELLTNLALNHVIYKGNVDAQIKNVRELKEFREYLAKVMEQKELVARRKQLPTPQTICTNSTCSESVRHSDGQMGYFPKIACHNKYVMELPPGATEGMDKVEKRCQDCGCSWQNHINIDYELEETMEPVATPEQRQQFENSKNEIEKAEVLSEEFAKKLVNLQKEYSLIKNISIEFSTHFGYYSLKSRTDPCLVHLNNSIEKEADMIQKEKYKELLEGYKYVVSRNLKEIEESKRQLKEIKGRKIAKKQPLTMSQLGQELEKLSTLEISGNWIAGLLVEFNAVPVEQNRNKCWTIHPSQQPAQVVEEERECPPLPSGQKPQLYPVLNE